jgi:hypothetical protein
MPAAALAGPTPPELREKCAAAINADEDFKQDMIKFANEETAAKHARADEDVQRNERHVILGYAAMWVIAAGFLLFLWLRQEGLNRQIIALKRELADAIKEGK